MLMRFAPAIFKTFCTSRTVAPVVHTSSIITTRLPCTSSGFLTAKQSFILLSRAFLFLNDVWLGVCFIFCTISGRGSNAPFSSSRAVSSTSHSAWFHPRSRNFFAESGTGTSNVARGLLSGKVWCSPPREAPRGNLRTKRCLLFYIPHISPEREG